MRSQNPHIPPTYSWHYQDDDMDWCVLSDLYRIAPMGNKAAKDLHTVFSNSRYKCFVFDGDKLIAAGRALADGVDAAYLCDIAVHSDYQGQGLGKQVIAKLLEFTQGHKKVILYAAPGKSGFYESLGFKKMNTAMAIFANQENAIKVGLVQA